MRCEGYRRFGGAFSLGPAVWEQCEEEAIVMLEVKQDNEPIQTLPGCKKCWNEAIENKIVVNAKPI